MTPEERAAVIVEDLKSDPLNYVLNLEYVADHIRTVIAAEREACQAAICPRCAAGEPVSDADECMTMGHFRRADTCHPFSHDERGRVTGHIGCLASAIRARTP